MQPCCSAARQARARKRRQSRSTARAPARTDRSSSSTAARSRANLLESELFGHEKGAFTGASGLRTGAFEEADGGTLFLDEIGELEPDLQPKLLRVLERREIKRVGSSTYFPVDVRIIAATNRNLRAEVNAKNFRSDLYYRLAVVEVVLPSLRERVEDLPILVDAILARLAEHGGAPISADLVKTRAFQQAVARHSWPGNVRELRNYVERCLALAEQAPLDRGGRGRGRWSIGSVGRHERTAEDRA